MLNWVFTPNKQVRLVTRKTKLGSYKKYILTENEDCSFTLRNH